MQEQGTLSIHTENIFPIIKKFLYSDHEIFIRELISNAMDATQKLKSLADAGEYKEDLGELKVKVNIDDKNKTITVSDRGIGMTADEIKKYINQIAFSGATEFIEKYKDHKEAANQIIGHFGLGFYSSFMVAKKVEILTRSYQKDSEAAKWTCDGNTTFEITSAKKKDRGTDIVLHIADDAQEFLDKLKLKSVVEKYCKFLPFEVEFEGAVINNPHPIWVKSPSDLKDEDYIKFYRELYPFAEEPLFWIHLNVDYPFHLTGILYFPKVKSNNIDAHKNKIQLYSRQVFITDEVKDIVPEFLMLLHGIIDSPDIPLNVSRSYLQADGNVKKINNYISKKVADKLNELFKSDRKSYEEKWESISLFVKYGMISDEKFYDKAQKFCLLKNVEGQLFTIEEYLEKIKINQTDKEGNRILLYTSDPESQDTYLQSAKKRSYDVLKMDEIIDSHFISNWEHKLEKTQLKRIDSDSIDQLISSDQNAIISLSDQEQDQLKKDFLSALGDDQLNLVVEGLPTDELPVLITKPEFMRRMEEMSAMGGMMGQLPNTFQVVINANHQLIHKIVHAKAEEKASLIQQAYDVALLSQNRLKGNQLTLFLERYVNNLLQ